jgi:hypothetical protein
MFSPSEHSEDSSGRDFLSMVGRGIGLVAKASPALLACLGGQTAAARSTETLSPEQAARSWPHSSDRTCFLTFLAVKYSIPVNL